MPNMRVCTKGIVSPIQALEDYFLEGGTSIVRAAFEHSYFVHPDQVRARTPWFPNRARRSQKHYPGHLRGSRSTWAGDGRRVTLGYNEYAQQAWARYTGHRLERRSGYAVRHIWGHPWDPDAFTAGWNLCYMPFWAGMLTEERPHPVRHIWGHPWDPDAFTAGWNLCYMPFWAGMLTEEQHPHPELQRAIRQASWILYFCKHPVCSVPDFVRDQGMDLDRLLGEQPLLVAGPAASTKARHPSERSPAASRARPPDDLA